MDDRSDAELLRALAADDRSALAELYRRHSAWLLARLSRRCADPDVVDQALQDTFVAVWRKPARLPGLGRGGGLAVGHRHPPPDRPAPAAAGAPSTSSTPTTPIVAVGRGAGAARREHGDLAGALDRLSPELRAVVQATVLDGLTTREAARLLGIPAGTVKTRMMRAKPLLREGLV